MRKIGVYLYTTDYGFEHKADYIVDNSIPGAKNKRIELVCVGLIEISTEQDDLVCDQFTIKLCETGDCLYSGCKKGSLLVFDTFALWEDNKGSTLLFDYESKKEYVIFDEAKCWINQGKFGGIIINGALIYKTDEGLFLRNLASGNKETIVEKRNINMFCVYGHKLYIGVDDSIIEIDMDTKNINEYSIEQIGTHYFVVVDGICYYTTDSNYNSSIDNVRIIELKNES